jgi:acyl-ACP thioesterase
MGAKLTEYFRLKYLDFTCYDVLAPHGVLDIFQDIAGKHSESYGMSFDEMLSKNRIWVLLRVKYKVIKNVPLYSKVNVTTWPRKKGLVDFDRETIVCDLDNNVLVAGISKWVVLDSTTRKIIPATHIEYNAETSDDSNFDDRFDKIKDFDVENLNSYQCKVEFCDTDHNGHTNNAKYACMVLNALNLNKDEVIEEFQIDFINESHFGDIIDVYHIKNDDTYLIKGINNNKVIFLCKIKIK